MAVINLEEEEKKKKALVTMKRTPGEDQGAGIPRLEAKGILYSIWSLSIIVLDGW
jgi:hypothetical protein